jgi:phenylpropionate dioxygenase-like ring-hydroxylating dioxygenase large terminal subunit
MFLRNCWYVAAFEDEVGRNLLPRRFLGEDVILYRTGARLVVALEDRCAHRRLPLRYGRLIGDTVQCGYHGIRYDSAGACIAIPGQSEIPSGACVRNYPVVERYRFIWIWMGDPELADPSKIPDFSGVLQPDRFLTKLHLHLKCNFQLHIDNLLDLSHIGYVHSTTTGNEDVVENGKVITEHDDNSVRVIRLQENIEPPRIFAEFGGHTGKVDMWQITEWHPPTYVRLSYGSVPAGSKKMPEGQEIWSTGSWGFQVFQGITPETDRTTHQMRYITLNPDKTDRAGMTDLIRMCDQVGREDMPVLQSQQISVDEEAKDNSPSSIRSTLAVESDNGLYRARQIMRTMLAKEAPPQKRSSVQADHVPV